MHISGLGVIQSKNASGSKDILTGEEMSSFASLFSNLIQNHTGETNRLTAEPDDESESMKELEELLEFLEANDLSQLESGTGLFEKAAFQTGTNIIDIIAEHMNLSMEELHQVLKTLLKSLNDNALSYIKLDVGFANENNHIEGLIQSISALEIKEVTKWPQKDLGQAFKILKLYDLLSAKHDLLGNKIDLKTFLGKVQESLKELLKTGTAFDKESTLQKVIIPLANELNTFKQRKSAGNEYLFESVPGKIFRLDTGMQGHFQIQTLSKPEQMQMMNKQGRPLNAGQLMQQFENILSKSSFLKSGGSQKLLIKLNPDHLGALRVELIQKDSIMIARILTSTASAKEMLDSQINGLKHAFSSQNIQVERIEVSQQMTQQDRPFNKDHQHQGEGQQQKEEKQKNESKFNSTFEEALLNAEV
ncbi:flagellar hook-length control protein FliK [Cytobacillus sp. NCCP-133]|uniref:flagellar hook-length control protein FliK n=1 Tax=Cytobacillus sp. NCCP-133 TaxID=766848 RepID=UPI002230411D|nr:flagellar hook-length control protein FliK [Cytobacillus sp. NCCP-133]GLB59346.1 hypothetical protein NCCP133_14790 [Cytobacillus sp. NCCP-133]